MLLETRPNLKIYIDLKLHRWFHQNTKQKKKKHADLWHGY